MEENRVAMAHQLLLQQIQRQREAGHRFPSDVDAQLRRLNPNAAAVQQVIPNQLPLNPNAAAAVQQIIPNQLLPNPNAAAAVQQIIPNQLVPNPNAAAAVQQIIPNQLLPNPNAAAAVQQIIPNQLPPKRRPNPSAPPPINIKLQQQQQQQHRASVQLAYQDAWRVCNPDFKSPFSSLEDACERLLPYHVVADYEAEEDDKIFDSATTGQVRSRSQQWDHNIAAKIEEFTETFEKQVFAFNVIRQRRETGAFRSEELVMAGKMFLEEDKEQLMALRAEMELRQKAAREALDENARMAAAMIHAEQTQAVGSQAHAEMMARSAIRANAQGAFAVGPDAGVLEQGFQQHDIFNRWGSSSSGQRDDRAPFEYFLNDDNEGNGEGPGALQVEWPRGGGGFGFDLNAR